MKLEKRTSKEKGIDQYILYVKHAEADAAFALMTPLEKGMLADIQTAEDAKISSVLKVLSLWAARIEEAKDRFGARVQEDGIQHEG